MTPGLGVTKPRLEPWRRHPASLPYMLPQAERENTLASFSLSPKAPIHWFYQGKDMKAWEPEPSGVSLP